MGPRGVSRKVVVIGIIAGFCYVASLLVLGLVSERQTRHAEVVADIGATWGEAQTLVGPVLVFTKGASRATSTPSTHYLLPRTLKVESILTPETRSRGIFSATVYTQKLKVSGTFATADALGTLPARSTPTLVVALSDTRSIETQVALTWGGASVPFSPGPTTALFESAGIHASVPYLTTVAEYPFSFELTVRGSDSVLFAPVGKETTVALASASGSPDFTGAFLPSERTVSPEGFEATWLVSSFGRDYPQTWEGQGVVTGQTFRDSAFGVRYFEGIDLYTELERSVKYAVLFILITFTVFFLFEVLQKVRVHPVQYLLVGAGLALFYLLLLSLSEHIGFLYAYLGATLMVTLLVTGYSASVLKQKHRALLVGATLFVLYAYLYFVLKLEDYALLFGSLLLFVLLASVMYLTRNVDWFSLPGGE